MAVETGARNTEKDIDFNGSKRGDECLTCGARARSAVTREIDRTRHGRMAVVDLFGVVACGGKPRTSEDEEHTAEEIDWIH